MPNSSVSPSTSTPAKRPHRETQLDTDPQRRERAEGSLERRSRHETHPRARDRTRDSTQRRARIDDPTRNDTMQGTRTETPPRDRSRGRSTGSPRHGHSDPTGKERNRTETSPGAGSRTRTQRHSHSDETRVDPKVSFAQPEGVDPTAPNKLLLAASSRNEARLKVANLADADILGEPHYCSNDPNCFLPDPIVGPDDTFQPPPWFLKEIKVIAASPRSPPPSLLSGSTSPQKLQNTTPASSRTSITISRDSSKLRRIRLSPSAPNFDLLNNSALYYDSTPDSTNSPRS